MDIIAVVAVTVVIAKFLIHRIVEMLCRTNAGVCTAINYRGKSIPAIGGIVFIPILLTAVLLLLLKRPENYSGYLSYMTLVISMGFAGVIDDLIGDRKTKGIINHMKCTLKGTVTTGFLKALIGFAVSCIISFGTASSFTELAVNVLIISLFANTINLFDLRPGRAVKVFLSMALLLLAAAGGRVTEAAPVIILSVAALLYIDYDLKEICMLGDTGANILGITLGYYSVLFIGFNGKLIILLLLVFINIMSDRVSIAALIEGSRVLSYLDSLGRGRTGNG